MFYMKKEEKQIENSSTLFKVVVIETYWIPFNTWRTWLFHHQFHFFFLHPRFFWVYKWWITTQIITQIIPFCMYIELFFCFERNFAYRLSLYLGHIARDEANYWTVKPETWMLKKSTTEKSLTKKKQMELVWQNQSNTRFVLQTFVKIFFLILTRMLILAFCWLFEWLAGFVTNYLWLRFCTPVWHTPIMGHGLIGSSTRHTDNGRMKR